MSCYRVDYPPRIALTPASPRECAWALRNDSQVVEVARLDRCALMIGADACEWIVARK